MFITYTVYLAWTGLLLLNRHRIYNTLPITHHNITPFYVHVRADGLQMHQGGCAKERFNLSAVMGKGKKYYKYNWTNSCSIIDPGHRSTNQGRIMFPIGKLRKNVVSEHYMYARTQMVCPTLIDYRNPCRNSGTHTADHYTSLKNCKITVNIELSKITKKVRVLVTKLYVKVNIRHIYITVRVIYIAWLQNMRIKCDSLYCFTYAINPFISYFRKILHSSILQKWTTPPSTLKVKKSDQFKEILARERKGR